MKAILKKLYGNNKRSTSVKTELREVKLSMLETLRSDVESMYDGMQDAANDAMDGAGKLEQSLGYLQGYVENVKELRNIKDDLIKQVLDLGIEVPQELENIDTLIEDLLLTDDFSSQNDKLQEIKSYVDKVFFT